MFMLRSSFSDFHLKPEEITAIQQRTTSNGSFLVTNIHLVSGVTISADSSASDVIGWVAQNLGEEEAAELPVCVDNGHYRGGRDIQRYTGSHYLHS